MIDRGEGPLPGSCEHGNECSGSTKGTIVASEDWPCCMKKVSPSQFLLHFVGKHHALNDVCGYVSVITRVVNLSSIWWWMVNFTLQQLYPRGLRPWNERIISVRKWTSLREWQFFCLATHVFVRYRILYCMVSPCSRGAVDSNTFTAPFCL